MPSASELIYKVSVNGEMYQNEGVCSERYPEWGIISITTGQRGESASVYYPLRGSVLWVHFVHGWRLPDGFAYPRLPKCNPYRGSRDIPC